MLRNVEWPFYSPADEVVKAAQFAALAHGSIHHRRKYTNEPYICHPKMVAFYVATVSDDPNMIAAAWMHDVLEDVALLNEEFSLQKMKEIFHERTVQLVIELTDISKPSDGNREQRKLIDRMHTAEISPDAKTIKLADLIDNTKTIVEHDVNFSKIYLREKELLLPYLKEGNKTLWDKANQILEDSLEAIKC